MRRPRPGLRTTIVTIVVTAVLSTSIALALLAYLAVQDNANDYGSAETGDQQLSVQAAAETNAALVRIIDVDARDRPGTLTPQALTSLVQKYVANASVLDPGDDTGTCATLPCWSQLPAAARQAAAQGMSFAGTGPTEPSGDRASAAVTPIPGIGHDWSVATLVPLTPYRLTETQLWRRMLLVLVAGVVFAVLSGLAVAFSIRRTLRRIAATARRFGEGDLEARVRARGSEEIVLLGESFNTMAEELNRTLNELHAVQAQQRRFVADVAHELRSPLATMTASLEGLHGPAAAGQRRAAELLASQTHRLASMVDDLLEISRFDAGQADLRLETVDLAELVADAVQSVNHSRDISVSTRGSADAHADPRRIHTVIRNLVSNAIRHGVPPIAIDIDGSRTDEVTITVSDAGPGIDPARVEELFARFSRGDTSRSPDGGSGLGLAIARENATLHRGRVSVSDTAPTRFCLTLPRDPLDRPDSLA